MLEQRFREDAAAGASLNARARCGVVVDIGFSFAHATPIFDGRVLRKGIRRINLGGKALTNYLKVGWCRLTR